jgi:hypothetical protein
MRTSSKIWPCALAAAWGCAARPSSPAVAPSSLSLENRAPAAEPSEPPPLCRHPPWRTTVDGQGRPIHTHTEARVRFTANPGGLALDQVRIYDEARNDVGFHYGGFLGEGTGRCKYTFSVFVYPATEPLCDHFVGVRQAFMTHAVDPKRTDRVLGLDQWHAAAGLHEAYVTVRELVPAFDQMSLYQRGRWFLKYRITFAPADSQVCDKHILQAVAALQVDETA